MIVNASSNPSGHIQFFQLLPTLTALEAAIELYELRAPINGALFRLDLSVGEAVIPTLPIASNTSSWVAETKDLAEVDVTKVAIWNMTATVTIEEK